MNSRIKILIFIVTGLLITSMITLNGDIARMALLFLVFTGTGVILSPVAEEIILKAVRSAGFIESADGCLIEVEVTVYNNCGKNIRLFIKDIPLEGMGSIRGILELRELLKPGGEARLKYTFKASRGVFVWADILAEVSDPFGLFKTELRIEAPAGIIVRPKLKKNRPILLRPWKTLSSQGSIPVNAGGSGTDFYGIREYHPGDPPKSLDWRMTARHPHKFFTREFIQEKTADIALVLDTRQKSEHKEGTESLIEIEIQAAASLAEMLIRQGHKVSLMLYGRSIEKIFPGYGKAQLQRILNCLSKADVRPGMDTDSINLIPLKQFSSTVFMIFISPLDPDDWKFFLRLRATGRQAMIISPDTVDFAKQTFDKDKTTLLALQAYEIERRLNLMRINQLSIPVIDWQVDKPLMPLVRIAFTGPLKIRKM